MVDVVIYSEIGRMVDSALSTAIVTQSRYIITWLIPVFNNLLIIYVALWGIAHLLGKIDEVLVDGLMRIIKISVIIALALNITIYSPVVIAFVYGSGTQLGAIVAGGGGAYYSSLSSLDSFLGGAVVLSESALDKAGLFGGGEPIYYIMSAFIWFGAGALTLFAAFLIIGAKIVLSLLLIAGPLFIVLALFKPTQKFTETWLGLIANYIFLLFFVTIAMQLLIRIALEFIKPLDDDKNFMEALMILVSCLFGVLVLRQIPQISAALGGGIAFSTMGAVGSTWNRVNRAAGAAVHNLRPTTLRSNARTVSREFQALKNPLYLRRGNKITKG